MSFYKYPQSKIIDQIVFKTSERGANRAYLQAHSNADTQTLSLIFKYLSDRGWQCIPSSKDGHVALEVRGFDKEDKLLLALSEKKWISGNPVIEQDKKKPAGFIQMIKDRSLQASGAAMVVADSGFAMYGAKEKSMADTLAGLSYLSGSIALLSYGRNDQSQLQIREMAEQIVKYAREKKLDIPETSAAAALSKKRPESAIRKVDNFFRQYPSEIPNVMYAIAGGLIAKSALETRALAKPRSTQTAKQVHEMRVGGWGDTLLGVTTIASGLLGTFIEEKAHDPDKPYSAGLQGWKEWIQERPLTIAGFGYMGSTLCHAFTTFRERKEAIRAMKDMSLSSVEHAKAAEKLKAIPWRVLFVGATLVGEVLMAISSKGHGEGVVSDKTIDTSAIAIAADLIVKQPENMQGQLIEQMATFLGRPDVLAMKDDEVNTLLRTQVEAMRKNPWALAEMANTPVGAEKSLPPWQAKITKPPSEAQPQIAP